MKFPPCEEHSATILREHDFVLPQFDSLAFFVHYIASSSHGVDFWRVEIVASDEAK